MKNDNKYIDDFMRSGNSISSSFERALTTVSWKALVRDSPERIKLFCVNFVSIVVQSSEVFSQVYSENAGSETTWHSTTMVQYLTINYSKKLQQKHL